MRVVTATMSSSGAATTVSASAASLKQGVWVELKCPYERQRPSEGPVVTQGVDRIERLRLLSRGLPQLLTGRRRLSGFQGAPDSPFP